MHVLGLPPAFTLSQDQTLHLKTACLAAKVFSFAEREPSARITCCKQLTCCCSTSARWTVILPAGVRTSYLRTLSKNPGIGLSASSNPPRRSRRGEPHILAALPGPVNTPSGDASGPGPPRNIQPFRAREPTIISGFPRTATPKCPSFPSTPRRLQRRPASRAAHCACVFRFWEAPSWTCR